MTKTWIKDDNGNRCSIERWGSKEKAQEALDSLKNCSGCSYCRYKKGKETKIITPKIQDIHQSVFAAASAEGALNMGNWHDCKTTHCRAGWVVTLAGEAGFALERHIGTAIAAAKIYRESSGIDEVHLMDFYVTNDEALAGMKRLADLEAKAE